MLCVGVSRVTSRSFASRSVHQPCLSDCAGHWLQCSAFWCRHSALWSITLTSQASQACTVASGQRGDRQPWRSLRLVNAPVFGPGQDAILNLICYLLPVASTACNEHPMYSTQVHRFTSCVTLLSESYIHTAAVQ